MSLDASDLAHRVEQLPWPESLRGATGSRWECGWPEPHDLACIWARADGITLSNGTRLLSRSEVAEATEWLKTEKALDDWPEDLVVIGERDDLVLIRDLDLQNVRAEGGVLEASTDALCTFRRVAMHAVAYIELQLGHDGSEGLSPEERAKIAIRDSNFTQLESILSVSFYPGSAGVYAHAAITMAAHFAAARADEAAMHWFARGVEARVQAAPAGRRERERQAAWRTCIAMAENARADEIVSRLLFLQG